MFRWVWMLMLVGLLTASGCDQKLADRMPGTATSGGVRRDAGQAVNAAADHSGQTQEEFQKRLDARLKELDAEIAMLRVRGDDLKDEARANWDRKMADLETRRGAARAKLAEISQSSAKAWKDVQKGAQSAWGELDKAFRDAVREF